MKKVFITIVSLIVCGLIAFVVISNAITEYVIIIQYENGVNDNDSKIIKNNELLPKLSIPEKQWYTFVGWYTEKDGEEIKVHDGKKYLIDDGKFKKNNYDIYANEIIFYAKYESANVKCFLEIDGDSAKYDNEIKLILYGEMMPNLSKPEKDYSVFKGWYTNFNGTEILIHNGIDYINGYEKFVDTKYEINNYQAKIYAKYDVDEFDVNIFLDGGSVEFENYSILGKYGKNVESLPIPTKENYDFVGWYTNKNGVDILVFDGEKFTENYEKIESEYYQLDGNKVTLFAKYDIKKIPVKFVYEVNEITKEEIIKIPYEGTILDYAPKALNQYNVLSGFCWALNPNDSIEKEVYVVIEEMTLYAVGSYIKFQNKYHAIESNDKSELLVDFRTNQQSNINTVYTVSSDLERIFFIGDPNKTYTNFSIIVSASGEKVELNLIDFKYSAQSGKIGLDASNLSNNSVLVINAKGNSEIKDGNGTTGSDGVSYNLNASSNSARHGGSGTNGGNGKQAIICNNVEINININGSLKLIGGNGAKGGNGGNGEGSAGSDEAQCGHGGNGGNGGSGGNAIEIKYKLVLNSSGNFSALGGNGADGGNAGSGGNNGDTGFFDRADHAGNGGNGGNAGSGGAGIYIHSNVNIEVIKSNTIFATGGSGGTGGAGGNGGNSCKNEMQSGKGGRPGNAGSGGTGGSGGISVNNSELAVIKTGGTGGYGGSAGTPGSSGGNVGTSGVDRSGTKASDGH